MNSSSFVKGFFFKDEGGRLAVDTLRVVLAFVLIIFVAFSLYHCLGEEFYITTVLSHVMIGLILALPAYGLSRAFGDGGDVLSRLSKSDVQTISAILAIVALTLLILANILSKQSLYVGAIVFAAIVGASAYLIGNKILNVEPLPAGVERKSRNGIFVIGWILSFLGPILGIIIGIYLYTRKDYEYSKVRGLLLVALAIIVWFLTFYLPSLFGYL